MKPTGNSDLLRLIRIYQVILEGGSVPRIKVEDVFWSEVDSPSWHRDFGCCCPSTPVPPSAQIYRLRRIHWCEASRLYIYRTASFVGYESPGVGPVLARCWNTGWRVPAPETPRGRDRRRVYALTHVGRGAVVASDMYCAVHSNDSLECMFTPRTVGSLLITADLK